MMRQREALMFRSEQVFGGTRGQIAAKMKVGNS